jgi:predicted nucleic acid-binding protein
MAASGCRAGTALSRPMDFADATLVHLAQRESLSTILTVDVADFQTYRIGGQKRFRILPGALL